MTIPTIGDMIAKRQELKAFVEERETALKDELKPFKDAILVIDTACGAELMRQGLQNFKSDDGMKVDSQAELLNFVRREERWDMVKVTALIDPVREFAAQHDGAPPPGVSFNPSVTCIIRKA